MNSKNGAAVSEPIYDSLTHSALQIDSSKRNEMIAMSAYFRAEKRNFVPLNDLADWFESEQEVDRHLSSFSS